ncbi:MAG: 23S rRNA (pseudouridine(1915)-N(3))-methyltransferase RlmH [Marinifilaceae bacterium]|jgi:23S rRNA (pseudouridine1915-N3)-methyltransferase|nr:23S rRNA (pseudouridine(1915)-N(3))-methyltransferase RlmH [Marinifilaceae bacterium]
MKIELLVIGKTDSKIIKDGFEIYNKRLTHYIPFSMNVIPDIKNVKNMSEDQQKTKEGEEILKHCENSDILVILDENGKQFSSKEFSNFIVQKSITGIKKLIFVIGGPYGFSKDVYARANSKISLSKMTFSHQMVRMIFAEQLYRAMTIIKGEPYHHE